MRRPVRAAGLSLVELLAGLALTGLLMMAVMASLQVGAAAGADSAERLDLQEQVQFAVRRIAQRIEQTPAGMLAAKADPATSGTWLAPALFDLRAGTAPGTVALSETVANVTTVLAEPVTSFAITSEPVGAGRTVVNVALTLARGNATASAAVSVRLGGAR